ncbi:MAG TPA: ABC transporter permease [Chloroflexota bacterium]|nr:ABC transporter permease [Chloroflexota bacterium]
MVGRSKVSASTSPARTGEALSRPRRRYTGWRLIASLYRRDVLGMLGLLILVTLAVLGIFVPLISPYPGAYGSASYVNLPPMSYFWFGTDELGRSIFDQTMWGIRSSFYVAALATTISTGLGVLIGLISGYFRGKLGDLFTSVIDIFLTLPVLPLMILLASVIPPSRTTVALVIGLFSWPGTARIVRGEAIRLRESDFVDAAEAIGCRHPRILFRHILPNAAPPIFINLSFVAGSAILAEAGLSFLGLGDPTSWSWGTILSHAQASGRFLQSWWYATFPSMFIALTVIALNFFGQAMTDVLNPRLRKR